MDKDLKLGMAAYQSMYSQPEEVEQIDEILGTGMVMAPKTDPKTGITSPMMQRKVLGINFGAPKHVETGVNTQFGKVRQYTPQQVQRYNAQPNRPSTIKTNSDGFQQSVAKPSAKPAPQKPQTASAAPKPQGSTGGSSGIISRNLEQRNQAYAQLGVRGGYGLQKFSYEPEGDQIDEVLGGQSGDGYIGHPRLGIKNPLSGPKKPVTTAPQNTGIAGRLGNRASQMDAAMKELRQSYEPEGVDLFDYLLEYLVAEGYADTNKAALAIMANMSEEWKQSIVEGGINTTGPAKKDPKTGDMVSPTNKPGTTVRVKQNAPYVDGRGPDSLF